VQVREANEVLFLADSDSNLDESNCDSHVNSDNRRKKYVLIICYAEVSVNYKPTKCSSTPNLKIIQVYEFI
jgi:hypothetical protein